MGLYIYRDSVSTPPIGPNVDVAVRLGWKHQAQFAGFYTAKEKGFFDEVNLNVSLFDADLEKDQVEELNSGEVDFSVMEAHQVLAGIGEGAGISAVMAVYKVNPHVLAARKDSGITSPKDFAGKRVGLSGGEGEGNALFRIFIDNLEIEDSVQYINLGFDTVDDFINQRADVIDLYRIDQPYLAQKKNLDLTIIPLDAYGFSTYGDVITTRNETLASNPSVVERFVYATKKGWEYALSNQSEAVEITMNYTSGDYHDADYQKHILQQSVPLIQGSRHGLGVMDLVEWSTLYESMRSAGVFEEEFNVKDFFTNEFTR